MRRMVSRAVTALGLLAALAMLPMAGAQFAGAAEFQVNSFAEGDQERPAVATLKGGGTVVVWQSRNQDSIGQSVYGQRYGANGAKLGKEFRINTASRATRERPAVAALEGGGFVVVWAVQAGDDKELRAQRFTATGKKVGAELLATPRADKDAIQPAVAGLPTGGFVVVWTSFDDDFFGIFGQRFSAAGGKLGKSFLVNTYIEDTQQRPAVVALDHGGGFVVVWDSFWQDDGLTSGVYGQRYQNNGQPLGYVFRINTTTASDQFEPRVAALTCGDFVVVWSSNDNSGTGVLGQRYSPIGDTKGQEFRVNTMQTDAQQEPDIVRLDDGGFVVVWASAKQDRSGFGVYGQRYADNNSPVGKEFKLNETTASNQMFPAVAPGKGPKGFVAVWESTRQDGSGKGIFGRRFKQ